MIDKVILFVDDNEIILEIFKLWFDKEFNKVYYVKNEIELQKIMKKINKIDIIFCDYHLRDNFISYNNGAELIKYFNTLNKNLTCFIITGYVNKNYIYRNYSNEFSCVIEKPLEKKDIMMLFQQ